MLMWRRSEGKVPAAIAAKGCAELWNMWLPETAAITSSNAEISAKSR